jgi:hypothetical protein
MRYHRLVLALSIIALIAVAGCGGGTNTVWVKGKLLKGGTRYVPPEDQLVNVTFVALELQDASGKSVQGGDMYTAEIDQETAAFEVPGPDRRGIPPGKYRVAVTQRMKREAFDAAKGKIKDTAKKKTFTRESDMLGDKYGSSSSPIIVQVSRSEAVVVDLDRPNGSPKP